MAATTQNSRPVDGSITSVDYLVRELAAARAENRKLRNRLPKRSRYSVIVQRAVVDGHTLVMRAFADESTSRVALWREGMSARRWQWGVAFLRYAGVLATEGDWRFGLRWQVEGLDECVRRIETSAAELVGIGGYKRLRALVKYRRRG